METGDWTPAAPNRCYQRTFYVGEVLSQIDASDPGVPSDIMELYRVAFNKLYPHKPNRLTQKDVQRLSRHIVANKRHPNEVAIPEELQLKYTTKKTNKPLKSVGKYNERWRTISLALTGSQPPRISNFFRDFVLELLPKYEVFFENQRHAPDCKGGKNCHKTSSCRHNIISTHWLVKKMLLSFCGARTHPIYKAMKPWLPVPGQKTRRLYFNRFWRPFAIYMKDSHLWQKAPKPGVFSVSLHRHAKVSSPTARVPKRHRPSAHNTAILLAKARCRR